MFRKMIAHAQESGAPPEGAPQGSSISLVYMMVMLFAVMWFFMIRPNQKRDRERRDMLASLSKGDRVVTSGGMRGTIVGLDDSTVVLKISEDPLTKVEFMRQAISQVTPKDSKD